MRRAAVLVALALLATGCGRDDTSITNGGRISGQTLTVYSLLPRTGPGTAAARDAVLGEKLALQQANGMVGPLTINYVALDLPQSGKRRIANTVRDAVHDPSIAAVIGDLSAGTARLTVPLFNAVGVLHVSPGVSSDAFPRPSGRRTFAPLPTSEGEGAALVRAATGKVAVEAAAGAPEQRLAGELRHAAGTTVDTAKADTVIVIASDPEDAFGVVDGVLRENRKARVLLPPALWATDLPERLKDRPRVAFLTTAGPASPGLDRAFRQTFGATPGPYAQVGYDAMRAVLAAVKRAGAGANSRQRIIDAYFAGAPPRRPWLLARSQGGGTRYERVSR